MNKNDLMDIEVWKTNFVFADIYGSIKNKDRDFLDELTNEELEKFINDNLDSFKKGFAAGIMTDWGVVAATCFEGATYDFKPITLGSAAQGIISERGRTEGWEVELIKFPEDKVLYRVEWGNENYAGDCFDSTDGREAISRFHEKCDELPVTIDLTPVE